MDRMSDPDAIEKFSDRFRRDLDYGLLLLLKRRRGDWRRICDWYLLEVESVWRMSATRVDTIRVHKINRLFSRIVLLLEAKPDPDGVSFLTSLSWVPGLHG